MFCPKCRTEYVEGFTVCRDCEISLVPELPAETSPPLPEDVEFEEVSSTLTPDTIPIVRSFLENEGIDFYILGEFDPFAQPIKIMVRKDQVDEAREILENLENSSLESEEVAETVEGKKEEIKILDKVEQKSESKHVYYVIAGLLIAAVWGYFSDLPHGKVREFIIRLIIGAVLGEIFFIITKLKRMRE